MTYRLFCQYKTLAIRESSCGRTPIYDAGWIFGPPLGVNPLLIPLESELNDKLICVLGIERGGMLALESGSRSARAGSSLPGCVLPTSSPPDTSA